MDTFKNIMDTLPHIPKQNINEVKVIYGKFKSNGCSTYNLCEHYEINGKYLFDFYTINENGNIYLIKYLSLVNEKHYKKYIDLCDNKEKLKGFKNKRIDTYSYDHYPIIIGKIIDDDIKFFNKILKTIYDICTTLNIKKEYQGIIYNISSNNKIYNIKKKIDGCNYIEKNYKDFKIVGEYDPKNKSITFKKKFEKEIHNNIKIVTLNTDNNIREASHIEKNRDFPGYYLVWYKCPTCSKYHHHGIGNIEIGTEIYKGTHCSLKDYGPSEKGQVKILITENTEYKYPKVPENKYKLGDRKKIIDSNFCTNDGY